MLVAPNTIQMQTGSTPDSLRLLSTTIVCLNRARAHCVFTFTERFCYTVSFDSFMNTFHGFNAYLMIGNVNFGNGIHDLKINAVLHGDFKDLHLSLRMINTTTCLYVLHVCKTYLKR